MEPRWDIEATGTIIAVDREQPAARVRCQIWIIPPTEALPGKWGGRMEVIERIDLRASDFMFRLVLDDGRTADCFAEFDLQRGIGRIDGNGPPPLSETPARDS
ncbi:MAG: hypothetical protein RMM58_02525 [Chloroflexota bacterium]|nr:hypothetical protein [Dehalococcoidia bacterium]MDW8252733.1 hypothetical protein [Chloroflexota bacterium]